MRDKLANLSIKAKSLKHSHKKILVNPVIHFTHIKFEQEAFLLTSLKRVDDLMDYDNGVKNLSPRNKASLLRGDNQVEDVEVS